MSTTSCSSSNGTIAIPYGILFSNGLYGLFMVVYCIFVTYLLFLQSMRKTVEHHDNTTTTSKSPTPVESTEKVSNEDPTTNGINKSSFTKSSQGKNNTNKTSYRIEQEQTKGQSSEYTRRGMLWSSHASWNLPLAPRSNQSNILDPRGLEHILDLLKKYDVDPLRGFLSHQDPLQRLPYARYHLW